MAAFCGLEVFATAPTFAFSHSQYTSDQSGAPPCVSRLFESGEKARLTNSREATSAETAWSTLRRLSVWRSKMVTCAFSPSFARSATATYLWLGDTAIAVMPSVFSVPGYCSGQCIEAYDPTHVCAEDEVMITLSPNCAGYKYEPATPYFEAGHADYYKFWPDSEYITKSDRGQGEPYLLRIVYPASANPNTAVVPGGDITISETAAHAVAADGDLDGELTLVQLHDIAATKYADEETPVWMVHSAKVHGGGEGHNLIFLYQWAGTFDPHHASLGRRRHGERAVVGRDHPRDRRPDRLRPSAGRRGEDGVRRRQDRHAGRERRRHCPLAAAATAGAVVAVAAAHVRLRRVDDTATIEDEDCRATCNALSAGLAIGGGALVAVVLVPVLCLLCILISVVAWCCVRKRRSLGNESATAA